MSNQREIKWRGGEQRGVTPQPTPAKKKKKRKSVVKLNLKCSEEDKQVGQSREEEK